VWHWGELGTRYASGPDRWSGTGKTKRYRIRKKAGTSVTAKKVETARFSEVPGDWPILGRAGKNWGLEYNSDEGENRGFAACEGGNAHGN